MPRIRAARVVDEYDTDGSESAYTPPSSTEHTTIPPRQTGAQVDIARLRRKLLAKRTASRVAHNDKQTKDTSNTVYRNLPKSSSEVKRHIGGSQQSLNETLDRISLEEYDTDSDVFSMLSSSRVTYSLPSVLYRLLTDPSRRIGPLNVRAKIAAFVYRIRIRSSLRCKKLVMMITMQTLWRTSYQTTLKNPCRSSNPVPRRITSSPSSI
jgi:hypothetical protein